MISPEQKILWAILAGNFFIGTGMLAPAGLINELSRAFDADAATVAKLIAYGGAVLCIESPLLAFVTNRLDRRLLLTCALALFAAGHLCSSLSSTFPTLLTLRIIMVAGAAIFTPQAAGTIALLVKPDRRATAIAFVFLGWSLASALGIPLVNLIGTLCGWQTVYSIIATGCALAAVAVYGTLPAGLKAPHLSVAVWFKVLTDPKIWSILSISGLALAGQYVKYPYIVVEIKSGLNASPAVIAALLALYGMASVCGTSLSTRFISRLGTSNTVSLFLGVICCGLILWVRAPTSRLLAGLSLFVWGIGISPVIAAQQARLVEANPLTAPTSIALNTSIVYLGQAAGTFLGGQLLVSGQSGFAGLVAPTLLALALLISITLHRRLHL